MPLVKITVVKDALTAAQKQEMLHRVTEAMVAVEGEALRAGIWVILEESVASGEWSVGGQMLTLEAMQRIREGKNPWENDKGE